MDIENKPSRQLSPLESEMEKLNVTFSRIEKAIAVASENFTRFNRPANALNPEAFFKNCPSPGSSELLNKSMPTEDSYDSYVKSGLILRLSELNNYATALEQMVNDFNSNEILPVVAFFEQNI